VDIEGESVCIDCGVEIEVSVGGSGGEQFSAKQKISTAVIGHLGL
jgi:hypothetical protein